MTRTNPAVVARNFADAFITDTRTDGTTFIRLADDRPEWMADAVWDAHDGELPNDWRYETCRTLVTEIVDMLDTHDNDWDALDAYEIADGMADIYTADLLTWLRDNVSRVGYVDDAKEEFDGELSFYDLMALGQTFCIRNMAGSLIEAIRTQSETADDA